MGAVLRYLFDITTSAHWSGPPVGITRVEAELARRARQFLGDELTFCVYDKHRDLVLALDDEMVSKAIDGTLQLRFEPPRRPFADRARRRVRQMMLSNDIVYHGAQALRGRSFTREQVQHIRQQELAALSPRKAALVSSMKPVTLDSSVVMISGGLDWEYKDLRALWALKQKYKFRYEAVVYDLIPIKLPHYVVPSYVDLLTDYFGELCWIADHALCISETTRRDWHEYCNALGAPSMPADVFPLGSDPRPAPTTAVELPPQLVGKRYALFVSTIEPRKNHRTLYEAWDDCVRQKLVDVELNRLVFVGRRGWAVEDLMRELALNPATRDTIVVLNGVDDAQLGLIYQNCQFVLFPSHYEGFGLPLAEALGYGKPCISSNAGALSEIGDALVIRLDPKDTPAWAKDIAHYLRSPGELKAWSERIRREYDPITWDKAASLFFECIKEKAVARLGEPRP